MIVFVTWLQEGSDPRVFILSFSPRVGSPNSCFSLSLLSVCLCLLWLLFYSFNERSRMINREIEGQKQRDSLPPSLPPQRTRTYKFHVPQREPYYLLRWHKATAAGGGGGGGGRRRRRRRKRDLSYLSWLPKTSLLCQRRRRRRRTVCMSLRTSTRNHFQRKWRRNDH